MYIRSSPRGPNRDPNRTLSNKLLLLIKIYLIKKLSPARVPIIIF